MKRCEAITTCNKRCKKKVYGKYIYCRVHNKIEEGICYMCRNECNPQSQICGRCARFVSLIQ